MHYFTVLTFQLSKASELHCSVFDCAQTQHNESLHMAHNKTVSNNTFPKSFSLTFKTSPLTIAALTRCSFLVRHQWCIELTNKQLYGKVVLFRCKAESKTLMRSGLHGLRWWRFEITGWLPWYSHRSVRCSGCLIFWHLCAMKLMLDKTTYE